MILEAITVGPLQVNCYILAEGEGAEAIIVDPGYEADKIKRILGKHKLKPGIIINTHGHIDHIGCDEQFAAPIYIHEQDLSLLRDSNRNLSSFLAAPFNVRSKEINSLKDKQIIELGQIQLEVIHTPGHTPGGICLWLKKPKNKILFTGDTLFYQGIGRTDFPGADESSILKSIREKLFVLADDTVIYPGHGPSSTIGQEKKSYNANFR